MSILFTTNFTTYLLNFIEVVQGKSKCVYRVVDEGSGGIKVAWENRGHSRLGGRK